MDSTALPSSPTVTPTTQAANPARTPDDGTSDFAALLLRAGQSPAEATATAIAPALASSGEPRQPTSPDLAAMQLLSPTDAPLPAFGPQFGSGPGLPAAEDALATTRRPAGSGPDDANADTAAEDAKPTDGAPQPPWPDPSVILLAPPVCPPPASLPPSLQAAASTAGMTGGSTARVSAKGLGGPGTGLDPAAGGAPEDAARVSSADPADSDRALAGAATVGAMPADEATPSTHDLTAAATPSDAPPPMAGPKAWAASRSGPDALPVSQASRGQPTEAAASIGQAVASGWPAEASQASAMPISERKDGLPSPMLPGARHPGEAAKAEPDPTESAWTPAFAPAPPLQATFGAGSAPMTGAASGSAAPVPPPFHQVAQVTIALAMGGGQAPHITLALEPEKLGRVEVRIERGAGGEASSVQVLAERPETLALLQRDARELDRTLAQAGLSIAAGGMQFSLSGGDSGQPQEQPAQQQGGRAGGRGHGAAAGQAGPAQVTLGALSLLDIAV